MDLLIVGGIAAFVGAIIGFVAGRLNRGVALALAGDEPSSVWHRRRLEAATELPSYALDATYQAIERERLAWEQGRRHRERLEAIKVISAALRDAGADAPEELREALLEECRKLDAESVSASLGRGV